MFGNFGVMQQQFAQAYTYKAKVYLGKNRRLGWRANVTISGHKLWIDNFRPEGKGWEDPLVREYDGGNEDPFWKVLHNGAFPPLNNADPDIDIRIEPEESGIEPSEHRAAITHYSAGHVVFDIGIGFTTYETIGVDMGNADAIKRVNFTE